MRAASGSTVAGIARVPFIVGIDRYLPAFFGKIHPKWQHTVGFDSGAGGDFGRSLAGQPDQRFGARRLRRACRRITIIIYFIPFLYMFAAVIKLANRPDRRTNPQAVLIPGGKIGVWLDGRDRIS